MTADKIIVEAILAVCIVGGFVIYARVSFRLARLNGEALRWHDRQVDTLLKEDAQ